MAVMPGITNLGQALAGEDLSSDNFAITGNQVVVKIDPIAGNPLVSTAAGLKVAAPIVADFFRSGGGASLPDGTSDYVESITHNGYVGLGQTINPLYPLQFGNGRDITICLYDNNSVNPNVNQVYGFGIEGPTLSGSGYGVRYQTPSIGNTGHGFYGGASPTASKMFMRSIDRELTIGSPLAPIGEAHWTIGTLGAGDNGYIRFMAPNASAGANKVSVELFCDGFGGGGGGINGSLFDIRTAATTGNATPTVSRILVNGSGDVLVSEPSKPAFTASSGSAATFTVNGSIRVAGGAMVPTGGRQPGGLTFGASSTAGNTLDFAYDTDGGITSIADNDVSIYCNGQRAANFTTTNAFKPGGGVWGALSDLRTKRDVTPHTPNPLGVLSLNPIEFYYNGEGGTQDSGQRFVGFGAQTLLGTDFAHWVTKSSMAIDGEVWNAETHTPEDQLYQVDSSNLVYELLGVVKSQAVAIEALTARLDALAPPAPPAATSNRKK
jgi:hypothetical protein